MITKLNFINKLVSVSARLVEFWFAKYVSGRHFLCISADFRFILSVFILIIWLVCMPFYLLSSE
jgi:hypothetical protein